MPGIVLLLGFHHSALTSFCEVGTIYIEVLETGRKKGAVTSQGYTLVMSWIPTQLANVY